MRKLTIAMFIASSCLLAEDAPKLNADFTKAALKALIIAKNGSPALATSDLIRYNDAMDDAEVAAATSNEKTIIETIRHYRIRRSHDDLHYFQYRMKAMEDHHTKTGQWDVTMTVPDDPQIAKDMAVTDACVAGLEKMLRGGTFVPLPDCDVQKEEPKPVQVRKEEPKAEPKPVEATQAAAKPAKPTYCFIKAKTPRNVQNMSRKMGVYECPPGVGQ